MRQDWRRSKRDQASTGYEVGPLLVISLQHSALYMHSINEQYINNLFDIDIFIWSMRYISISLFSVFFPGWNGDIWQLFSLERNKLMIHGKSTFGVIVKYKRTMCRLLKCILLLINLHCVRMRYKIYQSCMDMSWL